MVEELPEHWVDRDATARDWPAPRARWLRDAVAIAEALFEGEHGPPPAQHLNWLAHELDVYVAHVGGRSRLVVRAAFLAVAALAPALSGRWRPLTKLTLAERAHVIERIERSPIGMSILAVRATLCILWYEHPDNAKAIGIRPRPAPPRSPPAAKPAAKPGAQS